MAVDYGNAAVNTGTGALSGAAAGSVIPVIGTAAGAVIGGGLGLASSLLANNNQQNQQAEIANANLIQQQNQQRYLQALNALAMQRGVAGSVNGRGDSYSYDPATNTWRTNLSPQGKAVQNASDQASISRNTTDLATGQEANRNAMLQAILAQRSANPARLQLENFTPQTAAGLEGDLQQSATLANNQAEGPVIADTLRQFARSGTAAGPVLAQLTRDNANTLRQSMLQQAIAAKQNVGSVNASQQGALESKYKTFAGASSPQLNFAPLSSNSPSDVLAQEVTQRASGAASPATQGGYNAAIGANAGNVASRNAADFVPDSNLLGNQANSLGQQLPGLIKSGASLFSTTPTNYSNSPVNNVGGLDAYGNIIGAETTNPNWRNTSGLLTSGDNNFGGAG